MNKVFKIVFNPARDKMIVVNEITSSVQTGKRAAVIVSAMGVLVSTSVLASVDPSIDVTKSDYFNVTTSATSSELILTGGKTIQGANSIWAGGNNTVDLKNSLIKITGENGKTVFEGSSIYGGSKIGSNKTVAANTSEIIIKNAEFRNKEVRSITASSYTDGGKTTIEQEKTKIHLTNVTGNLRVLGGGRLYYNENSQINVKNSSITIDAINGGSSSVSEVIGGGLISGNSSQIGSWVRIGNTDINIGQGVTVSKFVVGGNRVNWFGNSEITGNTKVTIDGAVVDGLVIGGSYVDYGFNGALDGGAEGSTAERQSLAKAGTTSTVIVKNGSSVGTVVGGGYVYRKYDKNPELKLTSNVANAAVRVEDSTVKGNVIGGGYIFDQGGVSQVDVTESVKVEVSNSTVDGLITSDSANFTESEIKTVETSAKADRVSMALTNVTAKTVVASKGTLSLRSEGKDFTSIEKLTVADNVSVALSTDGAANDAAKGDITKAIRVAEGKYNASVEMDEGMYQGAVKGTIENGVAKLTHSTNSVMSNVLDLASSQALSMNRILMNDVRKRLGDIRSSYGTHGVWARYDGGKFTGSNEYKNDFSTLQFGIDTVPEVDAPRFGVSFAYTQSDADLKRGSADMDAYSLAFYGTKMYDSGLFVDVIGRMAKADTDVVVDGNKKGSLDNVALSVSGELGWRFDVMNSFYVEPQTELTYTYVDSDQLTLNSGHEYELDSVNSLIGRVGFAAGLKCPADKGNVYVRASAVHEFMGDASVRGDSQVHEVDGKDTWIEYGVGANFNVTKNAYVWADVERTGGATLDEDWRATVGVRYAW